jgi:hypothetical protein
VAVICLLLGLTLYELKLSLTVTATVAEPPPDNEP